MQGQSTVSFFGVQLSVEFFLSLPSVISCGAITPVRKSVRSNFGESVVSVRVKPARVLH